MRFTVLQIGKVRSERFRIEFDCRFRVASGQHHLLEGEVIRVFAACDPIVAVIANGYDGAGRVEIAHARCETGRKPRLRGH